MPDHRGCVGCMLLGCYRDGGYLWYALRIEAKHPIIIGSSLLMPPNFYTCDFFIKKRYVCIAVSFRQVVNERCVLVNMVSSVFFIQATISNIYIPTHKFKTICFGVKKSGCPIPRFIISLPCSASLLAFAKTENAVSVPKFKLLFVIIFKH